MADRPVPPPPPPYVRPATSPPPARPEAAGAGAPDVHAALEAIYRDVDAEISALAPRCDQRGICCDFDRTDHVLYASSLEIDYVKAHTDEARYRRPTGNVCPFLMDGACTAREVRMLGCRTYFCQEGWEPHGAEVYERAYARIRALARAHDLPWRYGSALEQMREGRAE
jgi:hypothetical protein